MDRYLCDEESHEQRAPLVVAPDPLLGGVVSAEVEGAVDEDAGDGDAESAVETEESVGAVDLDEGLQHSRVLEVLPVPADVDADARSREVERVDDHQAGRAFRTQ